VRDWLIYLQSTLWDLHVPESRIDSTLRELMAAERPEVRALFATACERLGWLHRLPRKRKLGRDVVAVQAVAAAAHRWRWHRPDPGSSSFSSLSTERQDEANP